MGGNAGGAAPGLHRSLLTPPAPISPLRLKISHLDSIFLSRVAWANVGGLPGEGGGGRGGWLGAPVAAQHGFLSHGPATGSSLSRLEVVALQAA